VPPCRSAALLLNVGLRGAAERGSLATIWAPVEPRPYRRRTATGRAMPFTFRRLLGGFNLASIDRLLDPMQCYRHRPNTRGGSRLDVSSRSTRDRAIRRVGPVDPFAARREHRFTHHPTRRSRAAQRSRQIESTTDH